MSHFDGGENVVFGNPGMGGMGGFGGGGGFGGSSAIWLILGLALFGRGFFGGAGAQGVVAADAAVAGRGSCADFLSIINAISSTKEAVVASAGAVSDRIDTSGDRTNALVTASFNATTANLTNQFNDIKSAQSVIATGLVSGFSTLARESDSNTASLQSTLCNLQNQLMSGMNCGFNNLNTNLMQAVNNLSGQNAQTMGAIQALNCNVEKGFTATACAIEKSTGSILCAINNLKQEARILELEEQLNHERRRGNDNVLVNLVQQVNTLQTQIGTVGSFNRSNSGAVSA